MMEGTRSMPNPKQNRRLAAALAVVASAALAGTMALVRPAAADTSLKTLAEANGKYFGTALVQSNLNNSTLVGVATSQFDMVTPGNEMKWDTTEPSNGNYNFGPGDSIVSFAQAHNMRVRGHNLVWHSQLPGWVSSLPTNQVQGAMEAHITTEATHYKGEVYAWDVVNEPFNEDGTLRQDVFYNAMGTGYIADAIRTAHAADPNAKLYLNDYNIEGENAKSNGMYSLAQSLLAQGVPLERHRPGEPLHPRPGPVVPCRRTCSASPRSAWTSRSPSSTTGSSCPPPAPTSTAGHRLRARSSRTAWPSRAASGSPSGASAMRTPGSPAPSPGTARRRCTTTTTSPSRPTTPPSRAGRIDRRVDPSDSPFADLYGWWWQRDV